MDTLATIKARYSCRVYLDKPVERELLKQLVDAGRRAPSGRKEMPVEFVVVTDPQMRKTIADYTNYGKFIATAGACILVIARDVTYYLEDGCAAAENILLAATALGLASCWVAGDKKPYARQILDHLDVPANYKLVAMLAIGYPKEPGKQPAHRPLDEVLHWERFGA